MFIQFNLLTRTLSSAGLIVTAARDCNNAEVQITHNYLTNNNNNKLNISWNQQVKKVFFFEVFHPEVLQYTNEYYTSVNNTTFILYTIVYMSKNPQHAFLRRGSKAVGPMS